MKYVSSDTNVWFDFNEIAQVELPFRLPYTYIMFEEAIEDEILTPKGLKEKLKECGLVGVDISAEEFYLAENYGEKYKRLSVYDRIALAIAKQRKIILVTGDGALRKAALNEEVSVIGTIGLLDSLLGGEYITQKEYEKCLLDLQAANGGKIRLPEGELIERISRFKKK